jgi:hypothetical protein
MLEPAQTIRWRARAAWLLAGLLVALALCGFARAERADAASLKPLRTGVSYVYGNDPIEFAQVAAAGGKWVLTPLKWWDVAPRKLPASWNPEDPADPNYDWSFFDLWVTNALRAGLTPVLQVRGAPPWGQNCPVPGVFDTPCKPDPQKVAAFSKAAAIRYSGQYQGLPRVKYWQALNEPNLSLFFMPQFEEGRNVSAGLYREILNGFYHAVKGVDPSNVVIAGGLGPNAVPGAVIGPMTFARELLCMTGRQNPHPTKGNCGGGVYFDIFDIHPYTSGGPTHRGGPDDVQLGDMEKLMLLLRAADEAGRIKGNLYKKTPLWITELSWDSNPGDPGGVPMPILSQWASEALYRTWKAGVKNFFWFSLVDFEPEGRPFPESLESGLYFYTPDISQRQPKEVRDAYRFPFVAFPEKKKGLFVWGRTPTSTGGKVAIQILRGATWHTQSVLRADAHGMFSKTLNTGYGANKKGTARAVYLNESSIGFPMRRVGDYPQPPFG